MIPDYLLPVLKLKFPDKQTKELKELDPNSLQYSFEDMQYAFNQGAKRAYVDASQTIANKLHEMLLKREDDNYLFADVTK
jgi:hypothetical protein